MRLAIKDYIKLIKLFWEVEKIMSNNNRNGIKTSEFLIVIINIIGSLVGVLFRYIDPETAAIIVGVLSGLYIISRTIVKATETTADDALLETIYDRILSKINIDKDIKIEK